jgi:hypothetical protein
LIPLLGDATFHQAGASSGFARGSIWPGVVMHTVGGAIVNTLIVEGYLSFNGHGDAVFSPAPNSIAFVVLFGLISVLMLRQVKSGAEARSVAGADPVRATIK